MTRRDWHPRTLRNNASVRNTSGGDIGPVEESKRRAEVEEHWLSEQSTRHLLNTCQLPPRRSYRGEYGHPVTLTKEVGRAPRQHGFGGHRRWLRHRPRHRRALR